MRFGFAILLLTLVSAINPANGQSAADDVVESLANAIKQANVGRVLSVSANRIDVSILGQGKNYSRSQAEFVIGQFFSEHPATSFRVVDSSTTGKGKFVEGLYYSTESRRPFRVYLRLLKRGDRWELRGITVESSFQR